MKNFTSSKPKSIPSNAKLMQGVGASSWFYIEEYDLLTKMYRVVRYSMKGELECDRMMKLKTDKNLDLNKEFSITFISHCMKCTIIQNKQTFELEIIP